jgi:hypothetical protein
VWDPTRLDLTRDLLCKLRPLYIFLFQTDLYSDDVELNELPTTIHYFASPGNSHSYEPDKFIYAWGSFLTSVDPGGSLHLIVHAHEVDW